MESSNVNERPEGNFYNQVKLFWSLWSLSETKNFTCTFFLKKKIENNIYKLLSNHLDFLLCFKLVSNWFQTGFLGVQYGSW